MTESCSACGGEYEVTPENAGLVMFLGYPPASHVLATCTHCQCVEVIYISATDLVRLAAEGEGLFPLTLRDQPSDDRRASADAAWARATASTPDRDDDVLDLPEAPRDWMRQLHDDLREFGRRP